MIFFTISSVCRSVQIYSYTFCPNCCATVWKKCALRVCVVMLVKIKH